MARRRTNMVGVFLPMAIGFPMASSAMTSAGTGAAAATAAGMPAAASMLNIASLGVATRAIRSTGITKKRR